MNSKLHDIKIDYIQKLGLLNQFENSRKFWQLLALPYKKNIPYPEMAMFQNIILSTSGRIVQRSIEAKK